MMQVESNIEKYEKMLADIPGGFQKAMYRSLNRALMEGRTAATRETTKRYTLKSKEVRSTFKMRKASSKTLDAVLISKGANLPLSRYAHRPKNDTTGRNRKRVKVAVKKGALKPLDRAFIWEGRVMQRVGQSRLPVEHKYAPAVPSILNNVGTVDSVQERMTAAVEKRMEHETKRLLEGAK